jgi:hypothetical protein
MAYHLDVKKLIHDMRGPKGVAALTEELVKVGNEVERLRSKIQPQAQERLHQARANFDELQKLFKKAQGDLDRELSRTITMVKKYGSEAEKSIKKIKSVVTKNGKSKSTQGKKSASGKSVRRKRKTKRS